MPAFGPGETASPAQAGDGAPPPRGAALAPLRQELRLAPGAPLASGAPAWILFDPLRHAHFQLGRLEQRVVAHWRRGHPTAIRDALIAEGEPADAAAEAVEDFARFAQAHALLRSDVKRAGRPSGWRWLLDHYLFIRIPLVRPAAFLARTLPIARRIWSPAGVAILMMLAGIGAPLVDNDWDRFRGTFANIGGVNGMVAYAAALAFVKAAHELGHAYTATRHGVRVPTMGVSLLVLVPVLYTDTSGAWRLTARRHRMRIDAAGIAAELSVAAIALFLWPFLPAGATQTTAFVLVTTSLATSLLVNASPFMRFDGYYLLSDWLRVPNLAPRAFALMRWRLREALFALDEPAPEQVGDGLRRTLIAYAVVAFAYRTSLYIGIALLVYSSVFKALGIILFLVEISVFLARPVLSELREWQARWPAIRSRPRARLTAAIAAVALVAAFLPLDRSVSLPAMLAPMDDAPLVAGDPARVEAILARDGDTVAAGQPLIRLSSPDLDLQAAQARVRIAELDAQLARAAADRQDLSNAAVLGRDLAAERDRLAGLDRRQAALVLRAKVAGRVVDLPDTLAPGTWTNGKDPLARVVTPARWDVTAYLPEEQGWRLDGPGAVGRFIPDAGASGWRVRLDEVGAGAVATLGHPALAAANGGPIATAPGNSKLVPTHALVALRLVAEARDPGGFPQPVAGRVILPARGQSLAAKLARAVTGVLIKESGTD